MKGRPTAAKHGATIGHRKERALSGGLANETYSAAVPVALLLQ